MARPERKYRACDNAVWRNGHPVTIQGGWFTGDDDTGHWDYDIQYQDTGAHEDMVPECYLFDSFHEWAVSTCSTYRATGVFCVGHRGF